jgi:hypothetical protein
VRQPVVLRQRPGSLLAAGTLGAVAAALASVREGGARVRPDGAPSGAGATS